MSRLSAVAVLNICVLLFSADAQADQAPEFTRWLGEMKQDARGPFDQIRWFCSDGSILPPKPYACREHGGGVQHGQWNRHTAIMRANGYYIANLLAGIDVAAAIEHDDFQDRYNQLLIEKYLIGIDDGWIFRNALFYRGAIQEEDEREGARRLLRTLAGKDQWLGLRFAALRTGARLLSHGEDTSSVQEVRSMAANLAERDAGFQKLRAKIHGSPDAGDAERVRQYASGVEHEEKYLQLANGIEDVFQAAALEKLLGRHADAYTAAPWLQKLLRDSAQSLAHGEEALPRYRITAALLAAIRDGLPRVRSSAVRLDLLGLSLAIETEHYNAGIRIVNSLNMLARRDLVDLLGLGALAAYGTGLLNRRSLGEIEGSLARLRSRNLTLAMYLEELDYLSRLPGWASQSLRFQFYESMRKLGEIEPLALHFIQDQLRGGPMLFAAAILDSLVRDGNKLAGVKHKLFGREIGAGFHALNPGLARGVLHTRADPTRLTEIEPDGIYLLPETVSDLPPVAGIITAGEGNPLSHVQLLARNLGIPNITVDASLVNELQRYDGRIVALAVSRGGLVELDVFGSRWESIFEDRSSRTRVAIRPDLVKLDLSVREFIDLDELRASDSGRIVGPKAAKLGELRYHFKDRVARGIAIPFGRFRQIVLDQPLGDTGKTVFEWMVENYHRIRSLPPGSKERGKQTESFRGELYAIVAQAELDQDFQRELRHALRTSLGDENSGVFVRSDTNVEDLAGFTGAGLNLTVPNVVGFDAVLDAIRQVWASPFTARAFAWRQSHMDEPQHVYPAVLLLRSVANDKSGVMVTQDIDTGNEDVLSVAVNEGVGGAVDGQSAESLRINKKTGDVRVLATATAPWRRVPSVEGGIARVPVSGDEVVLKPEEILQLMSLSTEIIEKFPPITDDRGNPAPADIEFGFVDGELQLFQLRPFLQNRSAQGNPYLIRMDKAGTEDLGVAVDMLSKPAI